MSVNLFDENPTMRAECQRALKQLESARMRRRGAQPPRKATRKTPPLGDTRRAFALAARERDELAHLRASGRPWACLEFVGGFNYDQRDTSSEPGAPIH